MNGLILRNSLLIIAIFPLKRAVEMKIPQILYSNLWSRIAHCNSFSARKLTHSKKPPKRPGNVHSEWLDYPLGFNEFSLSLSKLS